jgi:hypothetical protein
MHRTFFISAALLAGLSIAASAQQPQAGTWDSKTTMGPKDSVVATTVLTTTGDTKGWTMAFPNAKEPIAVRVVSMAGDSVVTEAGPFPSHVRPGQTVTLLHTVGHYKGDQMWGTSVAQYASGDKLTFKLTATRRK